MPPEYRVGVEWATGLNTGLNNQTAWRLSADNPIAGACYYRHDSELAKSHFLQNDGTIGSVRGDEIVVIYPSP